MPNFMPEAVRGSFSLLVLTISTTFWTLLLCLTALLKAAVPIQSWRLLCDRVMQAISRAWVGCYNLGLELTKTVVWDIQGADGLKAENWYLVIANHQSWVDIVVLQKAFHRKAPMLKFFLKRELIWVPILGIAWWVLEFPFLRRSTSVRKDLETTRNACEKFKSAPVSIMNFVEGTRFTSKKHQEQDSPYKHLLKPKSVGIALVLGSLGEQIHSILDVTIVYPEGVRQIWDFLCCRSIKIKVQVRQLPVTNELVGDYIKDRDFRRHFDNWLDKLWREKDESFEKLLKVSGP